MTIHDSLYFEFDGIKSKELKMLNVNLDGGMHNQYFASSQSINEVKIRGKTKSYFQSVEKDPLKISVTFAFEEGWDETSLRSIRKWLTEPTYYAPLKFSNNNEKIYYALYVDEPELLHNSLSQGYITINFRCNDAYAYSPLMLSPIYDWDESPLVITQKRFNNGQLNGVVLNTDDQITLATASPTWGSLPSSALWSDY
ncbi:distal tail protein Dit [Paenibacillus sp. NPDC058174]|uniref:distal tail protein Dit n=1 Tax=Paenibacillus sp. NPDC058174 TaxID=3346366 RepID=UPI0036DDE055